MELVLKIIGGITLITMVFVIVTVMCIYIISEDK